MDALEFIKERNRMCDSMFSCEVCPARKAQCRTLGNMKDDTSIISIVEKGLSEHPHETRQDNFASMA